MNNPLKISVFQYLPTYLNQSFENIRKLFTRQIENNVGIVENINYFMSEKSKTKNALISLSTSAWFAALNQYPNIKMFNIVGLTFEMIRSLNKNGYLVDIVDIQKKFVPAKKYDLFIGHGGNTKSIIDHLDPGTVIIQYVSGAHWELLHRESGERYEAFKERKQIRKNMFLKRNFKGDLAEHDYLTQKAHVLFTMNCPRMVDSFGIHKDKFYFTGYGAYIDELLQIPQDQKKFDEGRRNFIYVGGTGGNIQKGMDLLLESFIKKPQLNLYIYCKVEKEIFDYYKKELKAKNIHYIYHWRVKPFQKKLKKLMEIINFTIHAPINSGIGTAFMGSMGLGLIPVGYIDLLAPPESSVLSNSWSIDSLIKCIEAASNKSPEWCKKASDITIANFKENFSVEAFRNNFQMLIKYAESLNVQIKN